MSTYKKKVLIIEDDKDMAAVIKYRIESYGGSHCDLVSDPYEALNLLSDSAYDMVLVDQKLPGMLGSSVLSQVDKFIDLDPTLAELNRFSHKIPVVLMSGAPIKLSSHYSLKHFNIEKILDKKTELASFLRTAFGSKSIESKPMDIGAIA